jgi:hypothetical protein
LRQVWHNFSFDRHVLNNHGIECNGLAGDTMHMARMFDASRLQGGGSGYSLEVSPAVNPLIPTSFLIKIHNCESRRLQCGTTTASPSVSLC